MITFFVFVQPFCIVVNPEVVERLAKVRQHVPDCLAQSHYVEISQFDFLFSHFSN